MAHFYFPASGHTSRGYRCRPFPPPVFAFNFLAHRVQHQLIVDFSSSVANSRSRAFRKSISAQEKVPRIYTSTHSGGFELTKLTYNTRLEDNLIRHRVSELYRAGRPGGLVRLYSNTTINAIIALVLELNSHRCELWLYLFAAINGEKRKLLK